MQREIEKAIAWGKGYIEAGTYKQDFRPYLMHRLIEAATEKQRNNWIPISERLPEVPGRYLVILKDDMIDIDYYYNHNNEWREHHCCYIKAWQPLPEPYKEGVDDERD